MDNVIGFIQQIRKQIPQGEGAFIIVAKPVSCEHEEFKQTAALATRAESLVNQG